MYRCTVSAYLFFIGIDIYGNTNFSPIINFLEMHTEKHSRPKTKVISLFSSNYCNMFVREKLSGAQRPYITQVKFVSEEKYSIWNGWKQKNKKTVYTADVPRVPLSLKYTKIVSLWRERRTNEKWILTWINMFCNLFLLNFS